MQATILGANSVETLHGGAEVYAKKLSQALVEIGFNVDCVLPTQKPHPSDLLVINGSQGTVALWADAWVNRAKAVWVIPHDSIRTFARNNGWYWRRGIDEGLHFLVRAKIRQLVAKGAKVIAVSYANATELSKDFGIEPVIVPNGVEYIEPKITANLDAVREIKNRCKLLGGFVARWDTTKNPEIVRHLAENMPSGVGLVIRSTPDGIYRMSPWPPFKHPNVLWLGLLKRPELYGLYSLLDFLLLPSRYEGFGYVALEAASVGAIPFITPTGLGAYFAQDPKLQPMLITPPPFGSETAREIWPKIIKIQDPALKRNYQESLKPVVYQHRAEQWKKQVQQLALQTVGS